MRKGHRAAVRGPFVEEGRARSGSEGENAREKRLLREIEVTAGNAEFADPGELPFVVFPRRLSNCGTAPA